MTASDDKFEMRETDCTRSGIDRRQFSYSYHIPERRSGQDRRKGYDRKGELFRRKGRDHRKEEANLVG